MDDAIYKSFVIFIAYSWLIINSTTTFLLDWKYFIETNVETRVIVGCKFDK